MKKKDAIKLALGLLHNLIWCHSFEQTKINAEVDQFKNLFQCFLNLLHFFIPKRCHDDVLEAADVTCICFQNNKTQK